MFSYFSLQCRAVIVICYCYSIVIPGLPLIIEEETVDWPARSWSLETLCDKVGKNTVHVRSNTNCEDYKVILLIV